MRMTNDGADGNGLNIGKLANVRVFEDWLESFEILLQNGVSL